MIFRNGAPSPRDHENIVYGLRIVGVINRSYLDRSRRKNLRRAAIWDEVKDNLHKSAVICPAGSSSAFVSPGLLPLNPKYC